MDNFGFKLVLEFLKVGKLLVDGLQLDDCLGSSLWDVIIVFYIFVSLHCIAGGVDVLDLGEFRIEIVNCHEDLARFRNLLTLLLGVFVSFLKQETLLLVYDFELFLLLGIMIIHLHLLAFQIRFQRNQILRDLVDFSCVLQLLFFEFILFGD